MISLRKKEIPVMAVSSKPVHLNAPAIKLKGIKRAKAELNNNNNNNKNNDLSTYLHIWKKVKLNVYNLRKIMSK